MRRLLLLLLALTLAACDAGAPPSDLVGTWTGDGAVVAALVTSRADQTLLDVTQRALQPLTVTGDEDRALDYLSFRGSQEVRRVLLTDVPAGRLCGDACTRFETLPRTDGTSSAVLNVDGRRYVGELAADALRLTPTGYVLAPTTLRSDDTGAEVVVGGEMTFPTVAAGAGREAVVPIGTSQGRTNDPVTVTFGADGSFVLEEEGGSLTVARWTELGEGILSVNLQAVEGGSGPASEILLRGTVARDGDRLAFFLSTDSDADAARRDPASLRIEEERLHAETGSFTAFRPGRAFHLQVAASAR